MKTSKLVVLVIGLFAMVFVGCNPKEDQPGRENSGAKLTALRENLLDEATQNFTMLNGTSGGTITGTQGTQIVFAPNSLEDSSGNLITGQVDIELIELYDRADMVLMNRPTMGRMDNGDKAYLFTGGEFYVKITDVSCNCDAVVAIPYEIKSAPNTDVTAFDTNMIGFRGELVNDELTWIPMEGNQATGLNVVPVGVRDGSNGFYYSVFSSENGWTNLDRFASDPRPKTTLEVTVPTGFDDENCSIYLSVDGDDHGIAFLDSYNNGVFSEHYGQLPIGLEAHLIFITIDDNDVIRHQIKAITVAVGQQEHIDNITTISQTDLQTAIDALP